MKNSTKEIINEINTYRDESKAAFLPRFFKTGKGEYGEGDQFIGAVSYTHLEVYKRQVRCISSQP